MVTRPKSRRVKTFRLYKYPHKANVYVDKAVHRRARCCSKHRHREGGRGKGEVNTYRAELTIDAQLVNYRLSEQWCVREGRQYRVN